MIRKVDDLIGISDNYCDHIYSDTEKKLPKRYLKPCFKKLLMNSESNTLQSFSRITKYIKLVRKYLYIHDVIAANIFKPCMVKINTKLLNCLKSENLSFILNCIPKKHRKYFLSTNTHCDDMILNIYFSNAGLHADRFYKEHRIVCKKIKLKKRLSKN